MDFEEYVAMIEENSRKAGFATSKVEKMHDNERLFNQRECMNETGRGHARKKTKKVTKKSSRKLKVYGKWNYRKKLNPTIILEGAWLREWGFEIDSPIIVQCEVGKLIVIKQDVDD